MELLKREEYVYRDCSIRMSKEAMANLMYAVIKTQASIPSTFLLGKGYDRYQDSFNRADIKIRIHPTQISFFQLLSNIKLHEPIQVKLN